MKSKFKSPFFAILLQMGVAFMLAACGESNEMPHVFSGNEVPAGALAVPRLVSVPSDTTLADPTWPRLGDVPSKPQNFTPQPIIDEARKEMQSDRRDANKAEHDYENPMPAPLISP